ncbi:MAG: Ig-like domain-containing protein [Cyclobacteriaceae bacterium]
MKIVLKYSLMLLMILSWTCVTVHATEPKLADLDQYLKKSISWKSATLNREIPLKIYFQGTPNELEEPEVIVYLKNKAWERIGQEPDLPILSDYIQKRFIVITADYGNDPKAISPYFDKDLNEIFRGVFGFKTESLLKDLNFKPREYRCFFLPEGYRVATDLVYWEIDKHGAFGTMEFIMESYNEDIVPKVPGLKTVTSPKDMVDRKGKPFDFTVKMDIVYPSQPKKKLPIIIHSETLSQHNPNERPHNYSPHFAGFLTRGYAYAVMGHCFNPCVNHYFHFGKFTLDHKNGFACYTAAIRFLHAHADKYSLDPNHIGMIGYSKGEYAITRLSDPNHARGTESQRYEGFPEGSPEPQPWPGYPSRISAGMQGMGAGLFETEYITADYVPNILICGENDREVITKQHPVFVNRLEELGANHISLFMQGQGHELPYGYDERMGVDRYQLVHDFFDRYVRVEAKLPPVVLVVSPYNNREDVSPSSEISVQFAPVVDEPSILEKKAVKIIRAKDNKEINGSWKVSHGGTKFTFQPSQALLNNEQYKVLVTTKVKDKKGTKLEKEKIVVFKVAGK